MIDLSFNELLNITSVNYNYKYLYGFNWWDDSNCLVILLTNNADIDDLSNYESIKKHRKEFIRVAINFTTLKIGEDYENDLNEYDLKLLENKIPFRQEGDNNIKPYIKQLRKKLKDEQR